MLNQRDAAGFEVGGIDRVVDVIIGIEIDKPDIVRDPNEEILKPWIVKS